MKTNRIAIGLTFVFAFTLLMLVISPMTIGAKVQDAPTSAAVMAAVGTAFTYQGRLTDSGAPANGTYNFRFYLWAEEAKSTLLGTYPPGGPVAVEVVDGYFQVDLDFGLGVFDGQERWLEIEVGGTLLSPLQAIRPTPYALYAQSAPWSGLIGVPPELTSGGFWSLGGNSGTTPGTHILGTTDDTALTLAVNSSPVLRLYPMALSPNILGGHSNNTITAGVDGAVIAGGGSPENSNRVTDDWGTVSGGMDNQAGNNTGTESDAAYATVGGGRGNDANGVGATVGGGRANDANGDGATVGGGSYNDASGHDATVGGGAANFSTDTYATVGGGYYNDANGYAATVGGGSSNDANGYAATVGGGYYNDANGYAATVGGGGDNDASGSGSTISGGGLFSVTTRIDVPNIVTSTLGTIGGGGLNIVTGDTATIGGGYRNTAAGTHSTVGGGRDNQANGLRSTVAGGYLNDALGEYASVPGGYDNDAAGDYSFAGGNRAKTESDSTGSFVWGDSNPFDVWSHAANEFVVRATGGFWFISGIDGTGWPNAGYQLASGASSWSELSDRNAKTNFTSVDGREVLEILSEIPIETWSYKTQDPSIRHMGPMAQDFYAAFGLGLDERHIDIVDRDGVALAAAQGLYEISLEQAETIESLSAENQRLTQELEDMDSRLDRLERQESVRGINIPGIALGALLAGAIGMVVPVIRRRS